MFQKLLIMQVVLFSKWSNMFHGAKVCKNEDHRQCLDAFLEYTCIRVR